MTPIDVALSLVLGLLASVIRLTLDEKFQDHEVPYQANLYIGCCLGALLTVIALSPSESYSRSDIFLIIFAAYFAGDIILRFRIGRR